MKIHIKNMVCNRCVAAVQHIFDQLQIPVTSVVLGEVETRSDVTETDLQQLDQHFQEMGFQRLEDANKTLIENIKNRIIRTVNSLDIPEDFVLSKFLAGKLSRDYSSLSKTFSMSEPVTLEQYFILQKVEKTKELLRYNELSLTEISQKLGYRSVQHLSAQFKNTTGCTPSSFKSSKSRTRLGLDQV